MVRIRLSAILLLAVMLVMLPSCGNSPPPSEIVNALYENELSPPPGVTLISDAREGSPEYLSPELLRSAYGIDRTRIGIISAAVRLSSFGSPCEFAVFFCNSRSAAEDVALFCRGRIDSLIRNAAGASSFSGIPLSDYLDYLNNAAVIISGRYVALIISSDTAAAKRTLYKLL